MPSVLGSTPAHYRRLNLREGEISPWEDGLRTNPHEESFEWWYFDAALQDGSKLAVEFHTKPPHVSPSAPLSPFVSLTLDRPDGTNVSRTLIAAPEDFDAARERCDVRIGANTVAGDLHTYEIHVEIDGVVADLSLSAELPPWRPATGHVFVGEAEERFVAWLPAVPRGAVSGSLTIDGERESVRGTGYHDHNWGNAPLRKVIDHWHWGRARIGEHTVITLNFVSHRDHGSVCHPAFMVARAGEILAAGEAGIDFSASDVHPNAVTGVPVANRLRYAYREGESTYAVRFEREADILTLDFGRAGAYHRFIGDVVLEHRVGGELVECVEGDALWELLWFGAREERRSGAPTERAAGGLVHRA